MSDDTYVADLGDRIADLTAQLAAEREKSAGLERERNEWRAATQSLGERLEEAITAMHLAKVLDEKLSAALAAQKAAEERASKTDKALVRAHCDLRWYEGYSGKGSVALAENSTVGFSVAWEKAVVFAPQAPAASPNPYERDATKRCGDWAFRGHGDDPRIQCNKTKGHDGPHEQVSYSGITIVSWEDASPGTGGGSK